jgi:drug/metabolite transporter (DMT)-like permease
MNDRLSLTQVVILCGYAAGMTGGQLLFKAASSTFAGNAPIGERLFAAFHNTFFLLAIVLYAALTVLWVWILSFTPLSRAYPFVALAFAMTPLFASFAYGDHLSIRLLGGIILIMCGLVLVGG